MAKAANPRQRANRLLLGAINAPDGLPFLTNPDWELLLRVARRARLLGKLEADLSSLGLLEKIPPRAANHLRAARKVIEHRSTLVAWEVNRILWALGGSDAPIILLKGAAYVCGDLPPAAGRIFADVDLLTPEDRIEEVESQLASRGWIKLQLDPYDERYYRVWMHEIPPLRHRERGTEIDIHHRILPRTSRLKSDPTLLFRDARTLSHPQVKVLAPADMVLHALVHLFLECDPKEGLRLRDLLDVHLLLEHFGARKEFWSELVARALALGLGRPLFYGLRFAGNTFHTRVPAEALEAIASAGPPRPILWLMDRLVPLAMLPGHPDFPDPGSTLARWMLYVRAHWLRMPAFLLLRHLSYKAYLRIRGIHGKVDVARLDLKQQ